MLEFKNVSVSQEGGGISHEVSFVASAGATVNIVGESGSGKTAMLLATLGLSPVLSGFITVDGEPVDTGSGAYFRQYMGYVPQEWPEPDLTLDEMIRYFMEVKSNQELSSEGLSAINHWKSCTHVTPFLHVPCGNLPHALRYDMMLTLLKSSQKRVILIDAVAFDDAILRHLSCPEMADKEIVITSRVAFPGCALTVNI